MPILVSRRIVCILLFAIVYCSGFSQSKDAYVPCQEMPDLMQKYTADFRALSRFYSPYRAGGGGGFGGGGGAEAGGSPEKRARLQKLNNEYLKKVEQLNFKSLSQECKV